MMDTKKIVWFLIIFIAMKLGMGFVTEEDRIPFARNLFKNSFKSITSALCFAFVKTLDSALCFVFVQTLHFEFRLESLDCIIAWR